MTFTAISEDEIAKFPTYYPLELINFYQYLSRFKKESLTMSCTCKGLLISYYLLTMNKLVCGLSIQC